MTNSIDRAGRITEHKYDGAGRLEETLFPDRTSTFTHYDAAGRVDWRRDARGRITSYQRTPGEEKVIYPRLDGQPASEPHQFVESLFDGAGNLTDSIDAKGNRTHYVLDSLNRIGEVWLYPAGNGTPIKQRETLHDQTVPSGTEYSGVVAATAEVDATLKKTFFGHDGLGRLKAVTLGFDRPTPTLDAASAVYSFDESGNLTSQKDLAARETKLAFDSLGRRTKRTLPSVSGQPDLFEEYAHDEVGNLISKKMFDNQTITYEHDEAGRLLKKKIGNEVLAEYKYRADGQRAWMKYRIPNGQYEEMRYEYRDNRLWKKVTEAGTIEYDWDESGNLKSIGVGSHVVGYDWNARGQLDKVKVGTAETKYAYDEAGLRKEALYPNQLKTAYEYNAQQHLTGVIVTQNGQARASFDYNPVDRPLSLDGTRNAAREIINGVSRNVNYSYDSLSRLTKETIEGVSIVYDDAPGYNDGSGFDKAGNRRQRVSGAAAVPNQNFTYDARDRISGITFDNNGNITGANGATFEYDAEDRLIRRTGGSLPEVNFVYDGDGNRIRKTVDGVTTHYLVDDQNPTGYAQTLVEKQGADPATASMTKTFVWGHRLISQTQGSTTHYYLHDGHGSIRALVNGTTITDTYDYDAFGILTKRKASRTSDGQLVEFVNPAAEDAPPAGTQPVENGYRYAGEHFDVHLKLIYLRARWYEPNTGRFWTRDTFEGSPSNPLSLHAFTYASNDPVNRTDPAGRSDFNSIGLMAVNAISVGMNTWSAASEARAGNYGRATLHVIGAVAAGFGFSGGPPAGMFPRLVAAGGLAIPLAQVSGRGFNLARGIATVAGAWIGEIGIFSAMASTASAPPSLNNGQPLTDPDKDFYREQGRDIWQRVTGRRAIWDGMDVHHRIPLEWWHLFFGNPNRLSNLVGVESQIHWQVTAEWNAWRQALNGRTPTVNEVLNQVILIEQRYGSHFISLSFE